MRAHEHRRGGRAIRSRRSTPDGQPAGASFAGPGALCGRSALASITGVRELESLLCWPCAGRHQGVEVRTGAPRGNAHGCLAAPGLVACHCTKPQPPRAPPRQPPRCYRRASSAAIYALGWAADAQVRACVSGAAGANLPAAPFRPLQPFLSTVLGPSSALIPRRHRPCTARPSAPRAPAGSLRVQRVGRERRRDRVRCSELADMASYSAAGLPKLPPPPAREMAGPTPWCNWGTSRRGSRRRRPRAGSTPLGAAGAHPIGACGRAAGASRDASGEGFRVPVLPLPVCPAVSGVVAAHGGARRPLSRRRRRRRAAIARREPVRGAVRPAARSLLDGGAGSARLCPPVSLPSCPPAGRGKGHLPAPRTLWTGPAAPPLPVMAARLPTSPTQLPSCDTACPRMPSSGRHRRHPRATPTQAAAPS
eukprot:365702-Chlamydomonas_euryale.AAC.35